MSAIQAAGRAPATRALLPVLLFGVLGLTIVVMPLAAFAVAFLIYVALRGESIVKDGFLCLLIGSIILNYGFANLGFNFGGIPVPLTELLLLPLVAFCLLRLPELRGLGTPSTFLIGLLALAGARLVFDINTYGVAAIRDVTTQLEATMVIVGFWISNRYGLDWSFRVWFAIAFAVLIYGVLFPFQSQIAAAGPVVGLQQPVPLLGTYYGIDSEIVGALVMFTLRVPAPFSYILGAGALAVAAMLQFRGLYLAIPFVILVVMVAGRRLKTRFMGRLAGTSVVVVMLILAIGPIAPEGRLGPVNLSFLTSQMGTLVGKNGPGEGSYEHVGSSRVDLQACKLEYSIVSPK